MQKIIIAAKADNNVIGDNGKLPWHYPEDMEHFRETTTGYPVIMGRTTYQSLPEDHRPLKNRTNIVLTRSDPDIDAKIAESLEEAYRKAEETGKDKVFIAGGASIYEQTMDEMDRMVITEVHEEPDGDTYFPEIQKDKWREISRDDGEELSFVEYVRR